MKKIYSRLIDQEFKLRGWSKQIVFEGRMKLIPLGDKIIKIKKSLSMNEQVRQFYESINHNEYTVDDFYLSSVLLLYVFFIWEIG